MGKLGKMMLVFGIAAFVAAPAMAQPGGGRGGFGFGGGGGIMLLQNKSVQEELKVTDDQKEKLKDISAKMREKMTDMREKLQDVKQEERMEKMQELMKPIMEESNKAVKEVLKPEQAKRFQQIEWQQAGVQAYENADVQKALSLKHDQKEKISTILKDTNKQTRELFPRPAAGQGFDPEKMAEARKKMEALRKEAAEKVNDVLTAEQKKEYKELLGTAFEVKREAPRPPQDR